MSRESKLVKNTGILAIGQLSSKIFTFLLLPLYTSALLPEDYGVIDVLQTIISLSLYFVTMQLESALFRFLIEERDNKEEGIGFISSGIIVFVINSTLFTLLVLLLNIFINVPHILLFTLCVWTQGFLYLVQNIARGYGDNIDYSICSFIITLSSLVVNIILILIFHVGASSILIATTFSNALGSLFLCVREKIWTLFSIKSFSFQRVKEMLHYSLPLIPNAISWWIANTSDRLLIAFFLGNAANGIYAAANKIPTIYTTIFSVYNLAWSESVTLAMKDKDREQYITSMINNSYKFFSFLNLGIILCVGLLFNVLVGSKYSEAYNHVYILLISVFVNSMCSLYGGILTGFKDSKTIGLTTIYGAVANFLINLSMIKFSGLYAASVSTLVSYIIIFICRDRATRKYVKVKWSRSYSIQLCIFTMLVSVAYLSKIKLLMIVALFVLAIWGVKNNKIMLKLVFDSISRKMQKERN